MKQMEAYKTKEKYEAYIPERIIELTRGGEVFDPFVINAYPNDLERADASKVISGKTPDDKIEGSMDFILDGRLVMQFLFAGAATRAADILEGSSKYSFNSRTFNRNAKDVLSKLRKDLEEAKTNEDKNNIEKEINIIEKACRDFSKKPLLPVTLGARDICQYRLALESMSVKRGRDIEEVLKNILFIVHINKDSKDFILDDFSKNSFFGFPRENVVFIVQDNFCGHVFKNKKLSRVEDFTRPFGHGYALMQTVTPSSGFVVKDRFNCQIIEKSPLEYIRSLSQKSDMIMANVNVDDLTKLTSLVLDMDRISFAIDCFFEKENDVLIEGVWNIKGQKGGSWLKDKKTGKNILVEGLCLKTKRFDHLFSYESGYTKEIDELPLLNKMSNYYKIDSLLEWLPLRGLPNYIDIRKGFLFLESITGDVTQVLEIKAEAFVKIDSDTNSPEEIKTFKSVKDVYQVLSAMEEQEKDPAFIKLVGQLTGTKS